MDENIEVLLIEHSEIYAELLQLMLVRVKDISFEIANSLTEGFNRLASKAFDVVLLDLGLPDSKGFETLIQINKNFPQVPVIVLTGVDDETFALKTVQVGAQDYLVKGDIGKDLLVRSIRYAIERKRAQDVLRRARDELEARVAERTAALKLANERLLVELVERKRVEDALRGSETKNQALLNAIPDLIIRLNAEGLVQDVKIPNEFEIPFSTAVVENGTSLEEIFPDEITTLVMRNVHTVLHSGEMQVEEGQISLDGKNAVLEIRVVISGESEVLVIIRDITERKALEQIWKRYDFIVNTSRDLMTLVDREYRYQAVNDAYCRAHGKPRDQIIGKTVADIWGQEVFDAVIKDYFEICFSGQETNYQRWFDVGVLGRRFMAVTYSPFLNEEGQVTHAVVVSRDVTARKEAEEQLRQYAGRLRYLTERLVTAQEDERLRISRELHDEAGQALTALKMSLELTRNDLPGDLLPLKQRLSHAVSLTGQAMDQIRMIAHNLRPPSLGAIGLNLTLEGYCRTIAKQTNINFTYSGVDLPELSGEIEISLYRFLQEAITNVIKHAQARHVEVSLTYTDNTVSLRVMDDGKGFDIESKLVTGPLGEGRGIGLIGMKERMVFQGGHLEIKSSPEEGTTLIAYVPCDKNAQKGS